MAKTASTASSHFSTDRGRAKPALSPLSAAVAVLLCTAVQTAGAEPLQAGQGLGYFSQNPPSYCVTLSRPVSQDKLSGFVSLKDGAGREITPDVSMDESTLCVSSLEYGQNYTLTLKKGLEGLPSDVVKTFKVPDAPAMVYFERGNVLPLQGKAQAGVHVLNMQEPQLYVFRLNATDLNTLDLYSLLQENLPSWTLIDLLQNHAVFAGATDLKTQAAGEENANTEQVVPVTLQPYLQPGKSGLLLLLAKDKSLNLGLPGEEQAAGNLNKLNTTVQPVAAKVVCVSDLGLSAYSGDTLTVNVRSLHTARAVTQAEVSLLSRDNSVLQTLHTDSQGLVTFDQALLRGTGALSPVALLVRKGTDSTVLDLRQPALNLQEQAVPAPAAGSGDTLFAFTERGIYRPGEQVHVTALLRDLQGYAAYSPLSLTVTAPNGLVMSRAVMQTSQYQAGASSYTYALPQQCRRGTYTMTIRQGTAVKARLLFEVADFVPPQVKVILTAPEVKTQASGAVQLPLAVQADYTYGGAAEQIMATASVRVRADDSPFTTLLQQSLQSEPAAGSSSTEKQIQKLQALSERMADYHFGPADAGLSAQSTVLDLGQQLTDSQGQALFSAELPAATYPRIADVQASLSSGQSNNAQTSTQIALWPVRPLLGLKYTDGGKVSVVLCNKDGSAVQDTVEVKVKRVQARYQFVREGSQWQYRRQEVTRLTGSQQVKLDAKGEGTVTFDLPDGEYVFEATGLQSQAFAALSCLQGFGGEQADDSPARVQVLTDKPFYREGDTVKVSFGSPFDGQAVLMTARDSIDNSYTKAVRKGRNTISFMFTDNCGPRSKILLSLYAPAGKQAVSRAIGLTDLSTDVSSRALTLQVKAPPVVQPQQEVQLEVTALQGEAGDKEGQPQAARDVWLQAALIDRAVLDLTNKAMPDPFNEIFGVKQLKVQIRDLYNKLMQRTPSQNEGYGAGDAMSLAKQLSALNTLAQQHKAVVLWHEPVMLKDGSGTLKFSVPDFAGELAVLAVAWNEEAVSKVLPDTSITVRGKAQPQLSLPRYVRSGDRLDLPLRLSNFEAGPDFAVQVSCAGALDCSLSQNLKVKPGATQVLSVPVSTRALPESGQAAGGEDAGQITLKVTGSSGYSMQSSYDLAVLPLYPDIMTLQGEYVPAGQSVTITPDEPLSAVKAGELVTAVLPFVSPDTFKQRMAEEDSFGTISLCSRILYALENPETDPDRSAQAAAKVQDLLDELLSSPDSSGFVGLYGPGYDHYATALTALTALQAAQQGYAVSQDLLSCLEDALVQVSRYGDESARALAYYTQARYGYISWSDVDYFFASGQVKAPQSLAVLSSTFERSGDTDRAQQAAKVGLEAYNRMYEVTGQLQQCLFAGSSNRQVLSVCMDDNINALLRELQQLQRNSMAGLLPDAYALLALPSLTAEERTELTSKVMSLSPDARSLSPSDMYLMQHAVMAIAQQASVQGGAEADALSAVSRQPVTSVHPVQVQNYRSVPLYATLSLFGTPQQAPEASAHGVTVHRSYYSMDGRKLTLPLKLKVNEKVLVLLEVETSAYGNGTFVLREPLPSGFVCDSISSDNATVKQLLGERSSYTDSVQQGDSELMMTIPLWNGSFAYAYTLRPAYAGSSSAGSLTIYNQDNAQQRAQTAVVPAAFAVSAD